jgi:hypothetical protein
MSRDEPSASGSDQHAAGGVAAFDGCPGFVRGWCCKARERTLQRGYRDVGYLLAAKLRRFRPPGFCTAAWTRQVHRLHRLLRAGDDPAAVSWFKETYPVLMTLVPTVQQRQFLAGARERIGTRSRIGGDAEACW